MDTLSTARDLEAVGFEREKAEAIATAIGRSHESTATKADLELLATRPTFAHILTKADLHEFETRMTTRFYVVFSLLAGVVIASVKLL